MHAATKFKDAANEVKTVLVKHLGKSHQIFFLI